MARALSISFDEVLALLRGPAVQEFEAKYVADRGYALHDSWGNSQEMTRELQFAQVTREWIEQTLVSRGELVGRFWDDVLESEPDAEPETPVVLMRGFSIVAACSIWLLERSEAELVSWLKFRRILNYKKYAKDLRAIFSRV
jgi:hypothetical protein